jgi:hypothetical protein
MDRFLKVAIGLGVFLAGGGAFYHYAVYLPGLDSSRRDNYEACVQLAGENYQQQWAALCKTFANNKKDAKPDCTLPNFAADRVNAAYSERRDQCIAQARAGL